MQRMNFRTKNQLKWSTYIYIVLFFLVFLAVFLLLANLSGIIASHNSRGADQSKAEHTQLIFDRLSSQGFGGNAQQSNVVLDADSLAGGMVSILGRGALCERVKNHLAMLKQPFEQITPADDVTGLIIVTDAQYDQETLDWLFKQNDAGAQLLFLVMPPEELLSNEATLSKLGISALGAWSTYPGMRTSKEMMLGTMLEYDGADEAEGSLNIEAYEVELGRNVKLYAYALTEDEPEQELTELPPLFWRYTQGNGKGNVYVCNGSFVLDETAYALLPTVLGDIHGSFIYPIVNAYYLMIDGFPYNNNEERPIWREIYSRDAFGIQRELLLPEWERLENMYGTALTYFSPAYGDILTDANDEMRFYHSEFERSNSELAGKSEDQIYLYAPNEPFRITHMSPYFYFIRGSRMQLPYLTGDWLDTDQSLFRVAGMVRGLGCVGLRIDVEELLALEDNLELPQYFEQLESLLGYQRTLYPWLDRVTVQDALDRVDVYVNLQPRYTYHDLGVTVDLIDFDHEASFLLRTYGKDPKIDNGTIEAIGEYTYLVKMPLSHAEITWSSEEE